MRPNNRCFLSCLALAWIMAISAPASAVEIAPHRAIYGLSFGNVSGAIRFTGVEGLLTRSIERTCDGWIVAEHLVMRLLTRVGGAIDREVRFTGWESADGTDYRFAARTISKVVNEDKRVKGRLQVTREGAAGTARYDLPEGKRVKVPEGTYLPIGHLRKLLGAAADGMRQVSFHLFDGSEEKGPNLVSSFITGRLPAGPAEAQIPSSPKVDQGGLTTRPGWRVSAAFFEGGARQETPTFQIDMELLDNGVLRRMVLDLGPFSVIQSLREIQPLDPPAC